MSEDIRYKQLDIVQIEKILKDLNNKIDSFIKKITKQNDCIDYTVCGLDMLDVILRVDKRKHYFKVFHDMECNEVKLAALYAYWIVKLRPIMILDKRYRDVDGYNNTVNEFFAIHLMLAASIGMGRVNLDEKTGGVRVRLYNSFVKRLWYSFRFRNITIDSIIVLADTLTTDVFKLKDEDIKP